MEAIWPLSPFQSETNSTSDPDIKGLFITRAGLWFQIQFSWCFHCGFPAWRPPGRTPAAGPAPAAAHTVCPAGPGRGQRRDAGSDTGRRAARHSSAARHGSAAGGGAESPSRTDPAATWRKRTPQKHREPAAGRVAPATPRAAQEGNGQRRAGDKGRKDKQRQWRWPPRRRSADKAQVGSAARPSRQRPTGHRASGAATQPQAGRGWAATPARERGWRRQSPPPSCLPPHTHTHGGAAARAEVWRAGAPRSPGEKPGGQQRPAVLSFSSAEPPPPPPLFPPSRLFPSTCARRSPAEQSSTTDTSSGGHGSMARRDRRPSDTRRSLPAGTSPTPAHRPAGESAQPRHFRPTPAPAPPRRPLGGAHPRQRYLLLPPARPAPLRSPAGPPPPPPPVRQHVSAHRGEGQPQPSAGLRGALGASPSGVARRQGSPALPPRARRWKRDRALAGAPVAPCERVRGVCGS